MRERANWVVEEFPLRSNDAIERSLPPSFRFPFPARASCMRASRNSATARRRKHPALVLSLKQILIAEGELKGIEDCIGVLFLRYRGFQGYESAHRSRDRVNGTFSFTQFQCCDLEYCENSWRLK